MHSFGWLFQGKYLDVFSYSVLLLHSYSESGNVLDIKMNTIDKNKIEFLINLKYNSF